MMPLALYIVLATAAIGGLATLLWLAARRYFRLRGEMVVTCPETQNPAAVEVDAKRAIVSALVGRADLRLQDCSRWPERQSCGQECLRQVELSPEDCLVRTLLSHWYEGRTCSYCHRDFGEINWFEHRPALLSPGGDLVEWSEVPAEMIPEVLSTHEAVCWDCLIAEKFRRKYPDLVVDRPWPHGQTE